MREGIKVNRTDERVAKGSKNYKKLFGLAISVYLFVFAISTFLGWRDKVVAGMKYSEIKVFVDCVTVKEGDTLWSIAKNHHSDFYTNTFDYVLAIKECNGLEGDKIKPGMNIMVPYTERR